MENKMIMNVVKYGGFIVAVVGSIIYIVMVSIMVVGIEQQMEMYQLLIYLIISAISGLVVMVSLRTQGAMFAEDEPQNKPIIEEYNRLLMKQTKSKKLRGYGWWSAIQFVKDIFIKTLTVGANSAGIIYLSFSGNGELKLILMAMGNLIMFIGFGLLSLSKAYTFYNGRHMAYLRERIVRLNESNKQQKEVLLQPQNNELQLERVEVQDNFRGTGSWENILNMALDYQTLDKE